MQPPAPPAPHASQPSPASPATPEPSVRHPLYPIPEVLRCYGCGPDNERGLRIPFFLVGHGEAATVEGEWTAPPGSEGWAGILHGGFYAALHDDAAHWAMVAVAGRTGFTTRLDIRYLASVRLGQHVRITGRIEALDAKRGTFATEIRLVDPAAPGGLGAIASTANTEYAFVSQATLRRVLGRDPSPEFQRWLDADEPTRQRIVVEMGRKQSGQDPAPRP